jgi:hypothetical protein
MAGPGIESGDIGDILTLRITIFTADSAGACVILFPARSLDNQVSRTLSQRIVDYSSDSRESEKKIGVRKARYEIRSSLG